VFDGPGDDGRRARLPRHLRPQSLTADDVMEKKAAL
jgi:hypothetical protein